MDRKRAIGHNEALVLSVIGRTATISEICQRLEGDEIDDGDVYLALKRLGDRGLVTRRTVLRRAADDKMRNVGEYTATPEAFDALRQFRQATQRVMRRLDEGALAT